MTKSIMNVDDEDTQLGEEGKGTRCVSPLPPEGRLAFSVPHKAGHEARAGWMGWLARSGSGSLPSGSGKGAEGTSAAAVSVSITQLLFDPPSPWLTDRRMRHVLNKNTERPEDVQADDRPGHPCSDTSGGSHLSVRTE